MRAFLAKHWHRHKRKALIISPLIIFVAASPALIFDWLSAKDTLVSLHVEANAVNKDREFSVSIRTASTKPVNAFDVTLSYPTERLEVVAISTSSSMIDLWVRAPAIDAPNGSVSMIGGSLVKGGWTGAGEIASIIFKPIGTGPAKISVDATVLSHDGKGTDAKAKEDDAQIIIERLRGGNPVPGGAGGELSGLASGSSTASSTPLSDEASPLLSASADANLLVRASSSPPTDLSQDGRTSLADLSAFMTRLAGPYDPIADFNQDGTVNIKDLSIILSAVIR